MNKKFQLSKQLLLLFLFCSFFSVVNAQQVVIGNSAFVSIYSPINRTFDYNVYEVIYLASEINTTGTISKLAFNRADGTYVNPIDSVTIYMMHTSQSILSNGSFSLNGYTQVYTGTFPNDPGSGWREVTLTTPFQYNGTDNLQVITVKGYEPAIGNTPVAPRWYYFSASTTRARRLPSVNPIIDTTTLYATTVTSDIRLDFTPVGIDEIKHTGVAVNYNSLSGSLSVQTPHTFTSSTIEIINPSGKLIRKEDVDESNEVFIGQISAGIYFYRLIPEGKPGISGKFFVQ